MLACIFCIKNSTFVNNFLNQSMNTHVKLNVIGLTYSQTQSSAYALVLGEEDGSRRIPIVIGSAEAQSIAMHLQGLTPTRPLTHDLFITLLESYKIKLESVVIYRFAKEVFYSEMLFKDENGKVIRIDSRTSDAVALAVRAQSPIYTTEEILEQTGVVFEEEEDADIDDDFDDAESDDELDLDSDQESDTEDKYPNLLNGANLTLSDMDLDELHALLEKSIQDEDYERSVLINEEIKRRKEKS